MPFTVPNATDLVAGTIRSLDQAEPDSLDFQAVGNRRNSVISGAAVSTVSSAAGNPTPAYLNVTLSACEVVIDGVYGRITSNLTATVPAAPAGADTRFDVICAFNNSGTFQLDVVTGAASSNNPVFPVIPSTKIPLYAVYVKSGENATTPDTLLTDKRVLSLSSTVRTGTGDPAGTLGSIGDLYLDTAAQTINTRSGLWIKTASTTWRRLAAQGELTGDVTTVGTTATISTPIAQALVPTGAILPYGGATAPAGWLLCDGSQQSRSTYAALFAVIGTSYGVGNNSTTFNIPNLLNRFPAGVGSGSFAGRGTYGGAETHTIAQGNLPPHQHTINHNHGDHQHNIGHDHGSHQHDMGHDHDNVTIGGGEHTHEVPYGIFSTQNAVDSLLAAPQGDGPVFYNTRDGGGGHSHLVDIPTHSGSTGPAGVSLGTTNSGPANVILSGALSGDGPVSNSPISNLPPYVTVNYIIKT